MAINGKPRVVIWLVSNDGRFIMNAVNILERQFNGIETVGVTAGQKISVTDATEKVLPFIPLNELSLNGRGYDVLLVSGAKNFGMSEVVKFAKSINLDTEKLLGDWIVCIPGFTLDKYRQLQQSKLSIFAMNCFGGLLSNTLGLPFRSPFVNMFMTEEDYIKFLSKPREYMDKELVFMKNGFEPNLKVEYPIFGLGDVSIHMNHYHNAEEAAATWNERKTRINWQNLFVAGYTETPEILSKFDILKFQKKICFIPFRSKLKSACYINAQLRDNKNWGIAFGLAVNDYGSGRPWYYDPFDMLLYGKQTPLIDMSLKCGQWTIV